MYICNALLGRGPIGFSRFLKCACHPLWLWTRRWFNSVHRHGPTYKEVPLPLGLAQFFPHSSTGSKQNSDIWFIVRFKSELQYVCWLFSYYVESHSEQEWSELRVVNVGSECGRRPKIILYGLRAFEISVRGQGFQEQILPYFIAFYLNVKVEW